MPMFTALRCKTLLRPRHPRIYVDAVFYSSIPRCDMFEERERGNVSVHQKRPWASLEEHDKRLTKFLFEAYDDAVEGLLYTFYRTSVMPFEAFDDSLGRGGGSSREARDSISPKKNLL
jgi:hypothetical protein